MIRIRFFGPGEIIQRRFSAEWHAEIRVFARKNMIDIVVIEDSQPFVGGLMVPKIMTSSQSEPIFSIEMMQRLCVALRGEGQQVSVRTSDIPSGKFG